MQTAEMIHIADGQVLANLRALHDEAWQSSLMHGRPKVWLMDMLLWEIEQLRAAPFQPIPPTPDQLKAMYNASHPRADVNINRPRIPTPPDPYPWLDISGKFARCRRCHTLWSRDEIPEGQRPGNWWECPKGCKH